ncbi:DUF421 domain-containing protein [Orenia marismortui]|uniref:Uncharacterized membrane protein YcaP (DUF421 family) n=1 Tax=Orenia marismortui TaxID=46469 RepID=A0A4R8H129_9FIRM|nr:DUF421 domain-containing protein [Orenia marismortui]TDX48213.1 uncharacterized membrane protein YcaP (DUF421 family) [Orenia marismortui]
MNLFLRTIFIYFLTLTAMRLMGKREIGELTPFDLVVSLMIAELGIILIEDKSASISDAIIPIATLASVEIIMSYLSLKNKFIRKLINGEPTILIENGKIREEAMSKSRYTIHDLFTQLRENSIFNISDVEFAVLETSGDLTVIPKSQKRGLTPEDLGLSTEYEGLPTLLITDGVVNYKGLEAVNLDKKWLLSQLEQRGISRPQDVLLAVLETNGNIYISTY